MLFLVQVVNGRYFSPRPVMVRREIRGKEENAVCLVSAVRRESVESVESVVRKAIRGNVVSVGRRVVMVWQRRRICFWVVILRVLLVIVRWQVNGISVRLQGQSLVMLAFLQL